MNKLFAAFRLISRLNFHLPVVIIYMSVYVDDILTIAALTALYTLCSAVVLTLFSGRDFNAKALVMLGEASKVLGLILLIALRDYDSLFYFQILSGVGHGLSISGESKLAGQLSSGNMARSQTMTFVQVYLSFAVTGIVGVLLFLEDQIYPFMVSLGASSLSLILISLVRPGPAPEIRKNKPRERLQINLRVLLTAVEFIYLRALPLAVFVFFLPIKLFFVMNFGLYWILGFLMIFTVSGALIGAIVGRHFALFRTPVIQVLFLLAHGVAVWGMLELIDFRILIACVAFLGGSSAVSRPQAAWRVEHSIEGADKSLTFRYVNFFELLCSFFIAATIMALAVYVTQQHGGSMAGLQALSGG